MSKADYYDVLGVEKGADEKSIKSAYRKKAMEFHPDRNQGDESATKKFQEIQEAYEVLSDPQRKAQYDRFGHAGANAGGFDGFGGFGGSAGGFGDIFDDIMDMFGGGFSGANSKKRPIQGDDIITTVKLTFEEAALGTTKKVNIVRIRNCSDCSGTGAKNGADFKTCSKCNGTGQLRIQQKSMFGSFINVVTCDQCHGKGKEILNECETCKGKGKVKSKVSISVNIPAGIDNGMIINKRGEGQIGANGGPNGDLKIKVSIMEHEYFSRDEDDLLYTAKIDIVQAALGAEIEIPTLDNTIIQKVPAGTQSGTKFRVKGKGITKLQRSGNGDMYITIQVVTPKNLTDKQKEIFYELAQTMDTDYKENHDSFFNNIFKKKK